MREVNNLLLYAACVPKPFRDITGFKPRAKQRACARWGRDIEPGAPSCLALGEPSTGKTKLATYAVHKMLAHDGTTALYLTAAQYGNLIRQPGNEDAAWLVQQTGEVDLFVLDGLGEEYRRSGSTHFHDTLAELLHGRKDGGRTTMVTSAKKIEITYGASSQLVELLTAKGVTLFELD